jgi:voltage-gated potassium channel
MDRFRFRLTLIAAAIASTLAFGTVGFVIVAHAGWFDAFYMTLITVTTIGYGETIALDRSGRIFNSCLILIGNLMVLLAFGVMTQTVIELELNQFFGKRRVKSMIDKLQDHVIICGWGRVGRGAADELRQDGVPFVVIDINEDKVEQAIHAGFLAVCADASRDETLKECGIAKAKGLIATLASDADNLFVILSAKGLNNRLQLSARVAEESSEEKMRRAGAHFVFAPYKSTGHRMAQAIVRPHVAQFLDFSNHSMGMDVAIEQLQVSARSKFVDASLSEMHLRQTTGAMVLAIKKSSGEMHFNPSADSRIGIGDVLITIGPPEGLRKLEEMLQKGGRPE